MMPIYEYFLALCSNESDFNSDYYKNYRDNENYTKSKGITEKKKIY